MNVPKCSKCNLEAKSSSMTVVDGRTLCPICVVDANAQRYPQANVALVASKQGVAFSTKGANHEFHLRVGDGQFAFWGGRQ